MTADLLGRGHEGVSVGARCPWINVALRPGNITQLANIPENPTNVRPSRRGGRLARSGGNSCMVESNLGEGAHPPPSGKSNLPANCRRRSVCSVVMAARNAPDDRRCGALQGQGPRQALPTVSGVAMNPVDHPHGGGNHQAVHGPNSVARNAPPGSKVGHIAPKRTGRKRGKSE